jgi:hypothetical protein
MVRISGRVEKYYRELEKLAWTDSVQDQWLKDDLSPKEKPREAMYDMILRLYPLQPGDATAPFYIREETDFTFLDGKSAKKSATRKPTNPRPASLGLIGFLLRGDRPTYAPSFSYGGLASVEGRRAWIVEITYPEPTHSPSVIWDDSFRGLGVSRRFRITGAQPLRGRIWIDTASNDVLQFEYRTRPFEFSRTEKSAKITFECVTTERFKFMRFDSPTETFMVPESTETLEIYKGAPDGARRIRHTFADYKRFSGEIRITPAEK